MNIERTEFITWMERLMERFDHLKEQVSTQRSRFMEIDGEELLDNQDVMQRYCSDEKLPYYTISGKIYYKLSDVHQFVRDSFHSKQ